MELTREKILIVEDESAVSGFVARSLENEGFSTVVAGTGGQAIEQAMKDAPNAIVLDLMLPDIDGLTLLPKLREITSAPVIALTARGEWPDRVDGLNQGVDDYLSKPFRIEELIARIKALLRRVQSSSDSITIGPLSIDLRSRLVLLNDRKLFLSTTEFAILELLAVNVGKPISRDEILAQVWDDRYRDTNVVEVYISYLRNKLDKGANTRLIFTVRGKGYMLKPPTSP